MEPYNAIVKAVAFGISSFNYFFPSTQTHGITVTSMWLYTSYTGAARAAPEEAFRRSNMLQIKASTDRCIELNFRHKHNGISQMKLRIKLYENT